MSMEEKVSAEKINEIPLDEIEIPNEQARIYFNESDIKDLANDIIQSGLVHPIVVTRNENTSGKKFRLVSGERRIRAHRALGRTRIQARLRPQPEASDERIQLSENLFRADLHNIEKARSVHRYVVAELASRRIPKDLDESDGSRQPPEPVPENVQQVIVDTINKLRYPNRKRKLELIGLEAEIGEILKSLGVSINTLRDWFVATTFSSEAQTYFVENRTPTKVISALKEDAGASLDEIRNLCEKAKADRKKGQENRNGILKDATVVEEKLNKLLASAPEGSELSREIGDHIENFKKIIKKIQEP